MPQTVSYYFTPSSPWTYLGHERFLRIAAATGATIIPKPVDYVRIFPASGGLPLKQRAEQRLAYRLSDLGRWRDHLNLPLNLAPKYFPVNANPAALLLIAAQVHGTPAVMRLAGELMRACWVGERNIADASELATAASAAGLDGKSLLAASTTAETQAKYNALTDEAIRQKVFGAPTWEVDGELFWGQDRLDFLERALIRAA
ncbi:MAG: 2-hydroxychromene-2-carboxylate isomerase [Burkholderiales bacterium]